MRHSGLRRLGRTKACRPGGRASSQVASSGGGGSGGSKEEAEEKAERGEDEAGVLDLILHKEVFLKNKDVIREEAFFWVKGVLQRDGDATQVVVKAIEPIFTDFEIPIAPGAHAKRR